MIRIFLISLSTMLLTASCKTIPSLPTQTDCERPGPNRPAHCPKTCQNDRDRPFLIGLEPSDMMDLENLIANQKGLVAQYERCGKFRILTRCSIDGAYEVNKNQPRAQSLEINSASTLEANLPLSVGQLSAKVIQINLAGFQHCDRSGVVEQCEQQMLDRNELMAPGSRGAERLIERILELFAQH